MCKTRMLLREVKRWEEMGGEGKRGEERGRMLRFDEFFRRMSSTFFITRVAIDCSAIDHEVIDRNEISIVNVHSC